MGRFHWGHISRTTYVYFPLHNNISEINNGWCCFEIWFLDLTYKFSNSTVIFASNVNVRMGPNDNVLWLKNMFCISPSKNLLEQVWQCTFLLYWVEIMVEGRELFKTIPPSIPHYWPWQVVLLEVFLQNIEIYNMSHQSFLPCIYPNDLRKSKQGFIHLTI